MPAINPRRECSCHSSPVVGARFSEEPVGWAPFGWLAVVAAVLVPIHLLARGWGALGWVVLGAADVVWALALWVYAEESRSQRRLGLGYARLDDSSFTLGGPVTVHVGGERGLAGLRGIGVSIHCIDAVHEMRGTGQGEERQRICYSVWADGTTLGANALAGRKEVTLSLALPEEGTFAGPVGDHIERYWEVEVSRHGASPLRFRILVYPPPAAAARPR
jgi:hypothetical protein